MINANCIFCNKTDIIMENKLSKAFYDIHPVSKGHVLIVPKDHIPNFFKLSDLQIMSIHSLMLKTKQYLDQKYHPIGYNIGVNCGKGAGQAIMHAHVHLIPCYHGLRPLPIN